MVHAIEQHLAGLAEGVCDLTRAELCDRLQAVGRLESSLGSVKARLVAAVDALDDRGADGATVLRSTTRCSTRSAKQVAHRAEVLDQMPAVAEKFASGQLSVESVDVLVGAAEQTSAAVVDTDDRLQRLVETRPADLARREAKKWIGARQSDRDRDRHLARQVRRRRANTFTSDGGMTALYAEFDEITGARIRKRLDREVATLWRHDGGRDGSPDDVRTPVQRRADAVARMFGIRQEGDPEIVRSGGPDQLVIVADVGIIDGTDPEGRLEILDVGPVPLSVLGTLSPDTVVRSAIFDGPGVPLWLGRKRRLASLDQRLMLAIRDGGCRYCDAPTWRCEAHHVDDFNGPARGRTDVDAMEMVCPADHTGVHHHPRVMPRTGIRSARDDDEAA